MQLKICLAVSGHSAGATTACCIDIFYVKHLSSFFKYKPYFILQRKQKFKIPTLAQCHFTMALRQLSNYPLVRQGTPSWPPFRWEQGQCIVKHWPATSLTSVLSLPPCPMCCCFHSYQFQLQLQFCGFIITQHYFGLSMWVCFFEISETMVASAIKFGISILTMCLELKCTLDTHFFTWCVDKTMLVLTYNSLSTQGRLIKLCIYVSDKQCYLDIFKIASKSTRYNNFRFKEKQQESENCLSIYWLQQYKELSYLLYMSAFGISSWYLTVEYF